MNRGRSLARSRRGGHRRRKPRRAWILEGFSALAAVVVTVLAVGVVFLRPGGAPAASGAATARPSAAGTPAGAPAGDGSQAKAAGARLKKARDPAKTASGPSEHTDVKAVSYFKQRWVADKAVKRITDIRTVGKYLRIYTDLPESAHNSKSAIDLCKRGLEYLVQEVGDEHPVVFVQAEFGQNGNPVLANILGGGDASCRLTHPAPD
ncbi:hypothetical protein [Sphaerisporangium perillae]|uniref:hypothetical protein n=1 Tax=Sphaerisporangium perillae TaxID=2935860 RepID=UPI00200DF496|nr:hypothetical protein [Sphaerisporangium perillae]